MPTMTCPHCGYQWESTARSQKTRCGQCRSIVYVPASVRTANTGTRPRQVAPVAPAPVTATGRADTTTTTADDGTRDDDTRDDDTRPTGARRSGRHSPYVSSAPVQSPRPERTVPAPVPVPVPVQPAVGAVGLWSCGHEQTLVTVTTAREPAASRCRECGTRGLVAQRTADGWAPVEGAPPEQRRAQTERRTSRPVVPARFAGLVSPSAWPGESGWQPVEDRRRQGTADLAVVPRLRSPGAVPVRRDVVPGTFPSP